MAADNLDLVIDIMLKRTFGGENEFSNLLIQSKNVDGQKSHSVKLNDLESLRRNASNVGRIGVYLINFGNNKEYVLMRKQDFDYYFSEPEEA